MNEIFVKIGLLIGCLALIPAVYLLFVTLRGKLDIEKEVKQYGVGKFAQHYIPLIFISLIFVIGGFVFGTGLMLFRPIFLLKTMIILLIVTVGPVGLFVLFNLSLAKKYSFSNSHKVILAIVSFVGMFCLLTGAAMIINGHYDQGNIIENKARIIHKYTTDYKYGADHYLTLKARRQDLGLRRFHVQEYFYNSISTEDSELLIITKPGRLGFEWFVDTKK